MLCKVLRNSALALLFAPAALIPYRASAQVTVINMIPNNLSDEIHFDTEPYISVNPSNPMIMAAMAFMITPAMMANGPLLASFDGGNTWIARAIVPSSGGGLNTFDITIRFNNSGTALYGGLLRNPGGGLEIVRTTDTINLNTPMTLLNVPRGTDQPYIAARTVTGWYDPGKDRVWVGNNEGAVNPKSATVDQTLDAAAMGPVFSQIRIDKGTPVGRDNYQVRPTAHADGHVYTAFYRRKTAIAGGYNADVVVVRDNDWGKGLTPFTSLVDTVTMVAGENVAADTPVSDSGGGGSAALGLEWWGGDLYLLVDPVNSNRVYISYSDSQAGAPRTLHLRRSEDWGQTWGADILTTSSAKNAAIAVNSRGRIAYLYQQLTGVAPAVHWETHLRRSDDGVMWDNLTLADFPMNGAGAPGGSRIIGDYLNMVAVGKNFYGVFTSWNSLTTATFPQGVTWQRNKTPNGDPMPRFLGIDGVTTVQPSIDPFFFRTNEVDSAQDFYVRDWTDNAMTRDHGQEPSVRNNFYSTSDVWNERTNDPLAFDGNDRPQVHDPQPMAMGHNFAFARIGRETTGSVADVGMHYLFSDGGVGVNFVDAGSPPNLHFNAGDSQQSPGVGAGHQWDLPSGASNHVCLAVEISTMADPLLAPSLLGHAPGWPTTDLMVVNDNNKAQRNLQVFGFGGMSGGSQAASMYALVHNAATYTRNMTLGIRFPIPRDKSVAVARVIGGRGTSALTLRGTGTLSLQNMAPGENRWVEVAFAPGQGATSPMPVSIVELSNGVELNGYTFMPTPMRLEDAIRDTLFQHAAVFTRLAEMLGSDAARDQAKLAMSLISGRDIRVGDYAKFLQEQGPRVAELSRAFLEKAGQGDGFGVAAAAKSLGKGGDPAATQRVHLTMLNKLDAAMTMRQKADGDAADIPQTVRWQRDLFARLKAVRGAKEVIDRSNAFLAAFETRKATIDAYRPLVTSLMGAYREAAATDTTGRSAELLDALNRATSPTSLQGAHRAFLLALGGPN